LADAPLDNWFGFLQCQLRMEALRCLGVREEDLLLADPLAQRLWEEYTKWQGHNNRYRDISEKWVPYHTVFGAHELFVVQEIHGKPEHGWDAKQQFLTMFLFRAHCRPDLFKEAQLPHFREASFWEDPGKAMDVGGALEKDMLEYRRSTGKPLQTSAFRCVPLRLCEDADLNLVRNILQRSKDLLSLGEILWPIVMSRDLDADQLFSTISAEVRKVKGLGETWAKMLTACIDISYPDLGLLETQCDVGVGSLESLKIILETAKLSDHRGALKEAKSRINASDSVAASAFWSFLAEVEASAREAFKSFPTVVKQVSTRKGRMSAVTLQVQLCEWRQFCEHLARVAEE